MNIKKILWKAKKLHILQCNDDKSFCDEFLHVGIKDFAVKWSTKTQRWLFQLKRFPQSKKLSFCIGSFHLVCSYISLWSSKSLSTNMYLHIYVNDYAFPWSAFFNIHISRLMSLRWNPATTTKTNSEFHDVFSCRYWYFQENFNQSSL